MIEIRSSWLVDEEGRVVRLDSPPIFWLEPAPIIDGGESPTCEEPSE